MSNKFKKQLFELHNFVTVQTVCKLALEDSKFFAISGETGSGKTEGLTHFKSKNIENVIYIRLRKSMNVSHFFDELASYFGYHFSYKTMYRFINWIKNYIKNSEEKYLLIIDEGGQFKPEQYGFILELRDLTENSMGIILAGPKYFLSTLRKWNERKVKGIPEFYRRVNMVVPLQDLQSDETIAVCQAYGIKSMSVIRKKFLHIKNIGDLTNSIENFLIYRQLGSKRVYGNEKVIKKSVKRQSINT